MALHPACLPLELLLRDCEVTAQRRGGPGGQHRNKVSTAVVIVHRPTLTKAEANETRSRDTNHTRAVQRLRVRLALEVTAQWDEGPSDLWRKRMLAHGGRVSAEHEDYPSLLAEACERLRASNGETAPAAVLLGITGSKLVKFMAAEGSAWQWLAELRRNAGLHPLFLN